MLLLVLLTYNILPVMFFNSSTILFWLSYFLLSALKIFYTFPSAPTCSSSLFSNYSFRFLIIFVSSVSISPLLFLMDGLCSGHFLKSSHVFSLLLLPNLCVTCLCCLYSSSLSNVFEFRYCHHFIFLILICSSFFRLLALQILHASFVVPLILSSFAMF